MEEINSDSIHNELELASVVQLIDVIGVVNDPGALSIGVLGVGQGLGQQRRNVQ